ncbi:hypothetical protein GJAV_G00220370 [Gymnothorax javanicus]|nr:hypothetical protein GJAV_G00220370 [Gymnothorax javanicus]
MTSLEPKAVSWKGTDERAQGVAESTEGLLAHCSHAQGRRTEEQRCLLDPEKIPCTPKHENAATHASSAKIKSDSGNDGNDEVETVAENDADRLCNLVSKVQGSRMDEQRCSAPQTLLALGSPSPPRKAHSRPASPTVSPASQGLPRSASFGNASDKERVTRDGLQSAQQVEAPSAAEQEQFFSLLSHVQRGRMEEQRCLLDPNKKGTFTPEHCDVKNSDMDQLFRILASSQSRRLDDQRVSLNVLPGIQGGSGSDEDGQGKSVATNEMNELCNMVSRVQGSRMDEQRCSAPRVLLAPGSPPPLRNAHSRPASPAVSPSRLGPASISLSPDIERVQRDGLQTVQQKEAPSAAEQEQFFSLLSHVQRGRMEEQRCLFDPNKKSSITPHHTDATNSDPTQSSNENMDQLFRILASSQSRRLDDQRVSLNALPGIQRVSDSDQNGKGKAVPGQEMNELCDMVSKFQSSRLNEQRCSAPQILLDPRTLPSPRKAHSRPASPTASASSQGPPESASISPTPDKETVPRDGWQTALQVEAPSAAEQEQFFSLLSHVQRGRMEEQRCLFDPNKKSSITPHHTDATNSDPTHSSPADMDQLFRILASSQSRRLDDQRVSLNVLPGIQRVSGSDQNGVRKAVPGQEMNELCNMVSKFQSSRLDEQRCSVPQIPLAPGSPPPLRKGHSRSASPAVSPSSEGPSRSATVRPDPDKDRVQKDGLQAVQQSVTPNAAEQEQFFSLLSHVQRGRMEEQRCLLDPKKKSSFTPQHSDAANSEPTHSVPADMDRLFSILASSQSRRLDDQRVSLNVLPWTQGASGSDQDGWGMNELCNMVSRVQGSRMDEQRCPAPHSLLAPGSLSPPRKAHSRPASPTTSPDSQGLPRSASFSTAPDKERVQIDSLRTAQQGVAGDQEQFFSLLSHVQKGRMEEQRCHFDPNKRTTSTPKHTDATNSGPTLSSTADMDQLFSILASIQSHRLNDQRVSLHLLPDGLGKSVAGKETAELCNMVSRVQGCRIDDQRCSLPMALGPGPPRSASMGAGALDFALPRHDQFLAAPNLALPMDMPSLIEKPGVIFEEDDLPYEEEIIRNPYSVKCWMRYIEYKQNGPKSVLNMIYERALKELPGSYKLWYNYLRERRKQVKGRCITEPAFEEVNNCHERALVFMHKMPRIWLDYCQFLVSQCKITRSRRTFDRALRALPITQHSRIWPLYLRFARSLPLPETAIRVYRRYLKLSPENAEEYIDYLQSVNRLDEAAVRLAAVVNDESFVSKEGKSNYQLWHELCDLISQNPDKVKSLNVGAIIRGGLTRFTDQLGKLWCSLADYYIRSGHLEKARDVYEEAVQTVVTVRDFTQVFDSYAHTEETVIAAKMETTAEMGPDEEEDVDLELRLARFEQLIARRPLLLNSVLLRQNPHNVHEWHKRVKLYEGKPRQIISTYTEAVQTVDPMKATGKPNSLWISFAKFYEENEQLDDARTIFEKATKVNYKQVDELAGVWCEYGEMELRHENYEQALHILRKATAIPSKKAEYFDSSEPVQNRVYKSLKVWSMLADLEESLGTFQSTKAVYDRIIDLRIATPQIIINYAMFLEEHNYFEESFKAYERGIALFRWPNVYDIWNTYLTKFIDRYGGKKLERARDLFEQALDGCPAKFAKTIYLLYAKLEEEYGLARHAMAVYERATEAVETTERHHMFNIYIKRAAEIYGVTHTRAIYQKAIEVLPDEHSREMCLRFADMESKLGEIDRARAIYSYCSQICDPRMTPAFWQTWKEFEIRHGNEDTIREMLRIKRSVQATYNTQVNFMSSQMLKATANATGTVSDLAPGQSGVDDMKMLEQKAQQLAAEAEQDKPRPKDKILFVRSDTSRSELAELAKQANPDEIDIDDEDDEEDEEGDEPDEVQLEQKSVPTAVFGGLKQD